ncbi:MAG: glycosyltransferase [Candidatus Omnitrophica bacterium]|nr:glycosyltransferase [Candidatus Omnitrophota bacterium]
MNYDYKASVIITTFNRKENLNTVLAHLARQRLKEKMSFEVVIADDGSTDGTGQFIDDVISDKRFDFSVQYVNTGLTDVFGLAVARNWGIAAARGEYILFLDDDVVPHWNWVATMLTALESGAGAVMGYLSSCPEHCTCDLPVIIDDPQRKRLQSLSDQGVLTELLGGNCGVRRECFQRCGVFDERFALNGGYGYEDIEFAHRLLIGGYKIVFESTALAFTPPKNNTILDERSAKKKDAKLVWWQIIQEPQQGLPITPLLKEYAMRRNAQLDEVRMR